MDSLHKEETCLTEQHRTPANDQSLGGYADSLRSQSSYTAILRCGQNNMRSLGFCGVGTPWVLLRGLKPILRPITI